MVIAKMSHNGDMNSTGLCLLIKGWFGDEKKGFQKSRILLYIVYSVFSSIVKIVSILLLIGSYMLEEK
jgi:hypothetical protein